jgi:xanthine/CO dehydrogenase XdhC/CoxF family maturation factor
MGFCQSLQCIKTEKHLSIVTVLSGHRIGEKAIFTGSKIVWSSQELPVFTELRKYSLEDADRHVITIFDTKLFIEQIQPECRLVICGGGHVSKRVVQTAKMVGFMITVIDDRPDFAFEGKKYGADTIICKPFEEALNEVNGDQYTYFVIATRGHRYDLDCLRAILKKKYAYLGMMSSKLRAQKAKKIMCKEGVSKEIVDEIHSPIGIPIGSETPEEIALSIVAELVSVKSVLQKQSGYTKEIIRELIINPDRNDRVLATIVNRKGSAPREIGTKMIFYADGRNVGTIGGGCLEADVARKARRMLINKCDRALLYEVDLTGRDERVNGMVCGGIEEVLLEVI